VLRPQVASVLSTLAAPVFLYLCCYVLQLGLDGAALASNLISLTNAVRGAPSAC
jgi:hypothetical protein